MDWGCGRGVSGWRERRLMTVIKTDIKLLDIGGSN
jgi:hypothetical protein